MKLSARIYALAAIALAATSFRFAAAEEPAVPPGKYLLRYKFAMGEVLRYQVQHATNLRTTVDGTTQRVKTQSDSVKAWKVTDVLPSGDIDFIHMVESVRMKNEMPNQTPRTFDSASGDPPAPGFEAAARAVGVPLVAVRMTSSGKVLSREEKHPQQAKPSEDSPITLELPEQPVGIGDKWNHPYEIVVAKQGGAEMQIRTRRACRLRQVKSGVAVIDVEYQILTPVDPFIRAQIVERLTKGAVRFDINRGRVVQQSHQVDRREVGFAAKETASSMHFVARTQERLLEASVAEVAEIKQASASE
jgi:hypothetical protein